MFFSTCTSLVTALTLSFFSGSSMGQTHEPPSRFRDALHVLLSQHPALMAKRSELSSTQNGVEVAKRQFWPTPSISADAGPANFQGKNKALIGTLTVPIFTGGQLTADFDIAVLREQLARVEIDRTARELAIQMTNSYRSWWFHSSRIELIRSSYERMATLHSMMAKRSQAGVSAKLDELQATVQLNRLRDDLQIAYRQRDDALAEISNLLGMPLQLAFESTEELLGSDESDLEFILDQVMRTDPRLVSAELSLDMARAEIRKLKASTLPSVTFRANKQYGTYLGAAEPGTRFLVNTQISLGAGFSAMPLIDQATARAQAAQDQANAVQRDLRMQVTSLWREQQQTTFQRKSVIRQLETQESLMDAGLRLFRAGRRSWQDLQSLFREQHQLKLQLNDLDSSYLASSLRLQVSTDTFPGLSLSSSNKRIF